MFTQMTRLPGASRSLILLAYDSEANKDCKMPKNLMVTEGASLLSVVDYVTVHDRTLTSLDEQVSTTWVII
jgi:hypothetical protein